MWVEWIKNMFDTIKRVTDSVKKFNEKDTDFLKSQSTQSFIQYLNSTYKTEQIQQELWCSIESYISDKHHNLFQNKIKKWAELLEDITWIVSGSKIETTQLKEEIINNENIWMLQTGIQMIWWEQSPIKTSIGNFLWATKKTDKDKFLQSLWISLAPQDISKQPIVKKEEIITPSVEQPIAVITPNIKENDNKKIEITSESISKVEKVFEKYWKWSVPVKPETFISLMNKYNIPLELGLAQATIESNIWTSGWRPTKTKNIFNVGNVDNWSNKYMETREDWIESYAKLLKTRYSNDEGVVDINHLLKNWFRNKSWNKYATDPDYIKKLSTTITSIKNIIA